MSQVYGVLFEWMGTICAEHYIVTISILETFLFNFHVQLCREYTHARTHMHKHALILNTEVKWNEFVIMSLLFFSV